MFSINSLRKKVINTQHSTSFKDFILSDVNSLGEAFKTILMLSILAIPGIVFSFLLDIILLDINKITLPFNFFFVPSFFGILSIYVMAKSMHIISCKDEKMNKYFLSQQEMKDYLKTLPSKEYKKKAISLIESATKENNGNLNFTDFEKIYNELEEEVEKERQKKKDEDEKTKAEEASECLVKVLEKDIEEDDTNTILNKEREENVLHM